MHQKCTTERTRLFTMRDGQLQIEVGHMGDSLLGKKNPLKIHN